MFTVQPLKPPLLTPRYSKTRLYEESGEQQFSFVLSNSTLLRFVNTESNLTLFMRLPCSEL